MIFLQRTVGFARSIISIDSRPTGLVGSPTPQRLGGSVNEAERNTKNAVLSLEVVGLAW